MSAPVPRSVVDEVLARTDIADVISKFVELRRSGSSLTGLCPFHGESTPSFSVVPTKRFFYCFGCGATGDALTFLVEHAGSRFTDALAELAAGAGVALPAGYPSTANTATRPAAAPAPQAVRQHVVLSDYGRELWQACRPISGPARAYLEARCCVVPPVDGDLRWHPDLRHPPSGTSGPALVALVTDAVTREPLTLHRTWIRADGRKADVDPPRMLLGGHRKAGGVVRLWPDEAVTTGLGLAEGVETALSLALAHQPVWSCIDAGNLGSMPVLPGIEVLLIAADHDPAGIAAAQACADRWTEAGAQVRIAMPPTPKTDLNDAARAA